MLLFLIDFKKYSSLGFFKVSSALALLLCHLLLTSCRPPQTDYSTEAAGASKTPLSAALTNNDLLNLNTSFARIGRLWLDRPHSVFLDSHGIANLKKSLKAAVSGQSTAYSFVKCEARLALPDTASAKECAYLLDKTTGVEFEFIFRASDGQKICTQLTEQCQVRQVIRVRGVNDGVQRPAVFVEKKPLSKFSILAYRADNRQDKVSVAFMPGTSFSTPYSERLSQTIGENGVDFQNPIHVSNVWEKNNNALNLDRARELAFHTLMFGLSAGQATGALAALRSGQSAIKLGQLFSVIDLAAGFTGVASSMNGIFDLRSKLSELPQGPERASVEAAVFLADSATVLGAVSLGGAVNQAAAKVFARFSMLSAISKARNVKIGALSVQTVESVIRAADQEAKKIFDMLANAQGGQASTHIKRVVGLLSVRTLFPKLGSLDEYKRLFNIQSSSGSVDLDGIARPGIASCCSKNGLVTIIQGAGRYEKAQPSDWLDIFIPVTEKVPAGAVVDAEGISADLVKYANLLSSRGAEGANPELVDFVTQGKVYRRIFIQRKSAEAPTSYIANEIKQLRQSLIQKFGSEAALERELNKVGFVKKSLLEQLKILEDLL